MCPDPLGAMTPVLKAITGLIGFRTVRVEVDETFERYENAVWMSLRSSSRPATPFDLQPLDEVLQATLGPSRYWTSPPRNTRFHCAGLEFHPFNFFSGEMYDAIYEAKALSAWQNHWIGKQSFHDILDPTSGAVTIQSRNAVARTAGAYERYLIRSDLLNLGDKEDLENWESQYGRILDEG